jgi:hypothetical protein
MAEDAPLSTKTEFQNKLEEQAAAKGGLSYSYFAAGTASGSPATTQQSAPKPLSPKSAAAVAQAAAKPNGGSAWNAAGTYEERDVSAWARSRVETLLEPGLASPCGAVEVASAAAKGEAHVVYVRGKRRAAFELDVSLAWRAAADPEGISGTAKASQVTGDDVDDEDDVTMVVALDAAVGGGVKDGGDAAAALKAQKAAREGLRAVLCEKLRQLRQEMRDGEAM